MHLPKPVIIFCLLPVIIGLACLQPATPVVLDVTDAPVPMIRGTIAPAATPSATMTPGAQGHAPECAQIQADEALHLRAADDPHAQVLAFLKSGAIVKLISTKNPEWWLIKSGEQVGYARSKYLKARSCK